MNIDAGIRKRGKSYLFRVCMGYTPSGKQIEKTRTWHPPEGVTPKKADKLAREAYIEFKHSIQGAVDLKDNMRFKELVDWYFTNYAPNELKAQTIYTYQKQVELHFLPEFGNKRLCDFTPAMLTQFFRTHINSRGTPVSYELSRKLYCILQSIFTCAVNQGFIKETPCKNVVLPKRHTEKTRQYMTVQETAQFMQLTEGYSQVNTILRLLLFTGMRSGECLGLQWSDIDFDTGFIHVQHNLVRVKGKHILDTPKTESSIRYIAMGPAVQKLLLEHRKHHHERVRLFGVSFEHPEMVFTSELGGYRDRSALNTSLRRMLAGTGLEFLTLHKLRHCNASLLINNGVDLKIVSEHLGHSDISTTADIYADIFNETRRATAALIDKALQESQAKNGQITDKNNITQFKSAQ